MRARYLGDHDIINAFGIAFPKGVFVEVTGEMAQKKIAGNSHFEVEQSDAEDVEFVETLMAEKEPEAPADAPMDAVADEVQPAAPEASAPQERQKRQYTRRK